MVGQRPLILLVALALLGAGCGSSSDDETSPTAPAAETSGATVETPNLERLPQAPEAASGDAPSSAELAQGEFLRRVFQDVEALWEREFAEADLSYTPARLTIFRDAVDTACGSQPAEVGPFYCPAGSGVYLDIRFFAALAARMRVRLGDFAQAYVIAHEVAHHVQAQLGVLTKVAAADERDPPGANARSIRFELQADCLAGVWMHSAYGRGQLSASDFEDALRAAAVVGDDVQQKHATGTIAPHDWTHGSAAQRQYWLRTGFEEGRPDSCDTFRIQTP